MAFVVGGSPGHAGNHGGHGVVGFLSHLGSDVKDAAFGLPKGMLMTAEHPVRSAEQIGKATWQTWSPLFHGHVGTFAHQTYDHPLAPLLDVMSVFTGGAGLAAKLGTKAGELGLVDQGSALARLGKASKHMIEDKAGRPALPKYTSTNPVTRLGQGQAIKLMHAADKHLPSWFTEHIFGTQATYNRLHFTDIAHRHAAMNMQIAAAMQAGKALDNVGKLPAMEHTVFAHNYFNLLRHARTLRAGEELPKGYAYVREFSTENAAKLFYQHNPSADFGQFSRRVRNLGRRFTVRNEKFAAKAGGGKLVKIVPLHDAKALGLEAERSATFLRTLYRTPTKLWKTILLGYSPRVVINNGVGNWFMYAMRQGGSHSLRGLVDAVRFARSEKKAAQLLKVTGKSAPEHFMRRYFGDELGNTFGFNTLASDTGKIPSKLSQGLYPAVHKLADQPVRVAAISAFLRDDPAVRALMKKGVPFEKAADRVLAKNPELRDQASLHARKIAGDYFTMTPAERVMRDFIPFYLWDKHIVKHVANLAAERPGRLALAAAVGKSGADQLRSQLGDIPDFMLNSIPLPGKQGGRQSLLSTVGMNPYSTIPDLYDFGQALSTGGTLKTGESIGSQLNPLLSNLIEQVSGHSLTTDGSVPRHGGLVSSVLTGTAEGLPAVQLLEKAAGKTVKTKKPTLYKHSLDEILSSLAGVPIKQADLARAHELARQDAGIKQSKRHRRGFTVG